MRIVRVLALSISALSLTSIQPAIHAQTSSQVDELVRSSHIIFVGQVARLRATNVKVLSPSENRVLVRVSEVLDAPPSVASLKGEVVTVQVARPGEVSPGDTDVFFTNGLVYGEHLAVSEVGHLRAPANTSELRQQISAVRTDTENEKLAARVNGATLIIVGTVLEVKALERTGLRSEHEPDWAEAILQVESVDKGTWREKTITVTFPQSTDERWLLSPKFKSGQTGIWLLRHLENLGLASSTWVALHPLDFQPMEQRERIHKLVH